MGANFHPYGTTRQVTFRNGMPNFGSISLLPTWKETPMTSIINYTSESWPRGIKHERRSGQLSVQIRDSVIEGAIMRHVKRHDHSPNDITSIQQATVANSSTGIGLKVKVRSNSRTHRGFCCRSSSATATTTTNTTTTITNINHHHDARRFHAPIRR